ncbi:adaptor protein MecA [Lactobacillus sp. LC28-10]|uniref:Adapter protein MecA n=1 Tax=Secundilactobacillus angelensis TaxID=2722706 RepID=A0ABX1L0N4_9LACO|nr:adaptor protein MecA [Secundilactobacillus angelensis]MCH5463152.1 adaptor protein MecA [Secundilactobacillus angelensis]NLR19005.1 adaptor protein MecA [Secundilactobacillus angelensis]
MEMERINENTIRVVIGNDDLTQRGITVLDLLGNHKQIESFFYSILEEVDVDHQFQETDAVTFQVLPNRNGLELFISKGGADDIPTDTEDETDSPDIEMVNEDEVPDFLKKQLMQTDGDTTEDKQESTSDQQTSPVTKTSPLHTTVLKLHNFDDMIAIAGALKLSDAASNLYHYKTDYYLELIFRVNETSPESIKDELAVAYEYAEKTKITADVLDEHGKKIMAQSALELTRRYFSVK